MKKSIMATNRGIIKTLEYRWEKITGSGKDVEYLMAKEVAGGLAIEQYRKMCGGCHLWKKRGDRPGEIGKRGGGCSDCHMIDKERQGPMDVTDFQHPEITTRIPSENCIKCHNRSARTGLSYFGKFESEGYGTPYDGRRLNQRRLSGGRFYINLPADIHFVKAGMTCIDCHTEAGVMGDGKKYETLKGQLD
ncbi:MAG: amino acid ABC transporter substrate-binding protein, partial [Deltaproteobacteria bacterium]|nr:amino acid ABC transporter substrate-binding protein [Deltaproteobacteria bacterium]